MSNLTVSDAISSALINGDISKLTSDQKLSYYNSLCGSLGLNPLTKPFEYMRLNGKETLYATKGCAEQLRANQRISIKIVETKKIDDIYLVVAEASGNDGRVDSSTGAVNIAGLKGEQLANAIMKAETKAKRRVTLSICGLNMLDEDEVSTIPAARKVEEKPEPKDVSASHTIAPPQHTTYKETPPKEDVIGQTNLGGPYQVTFGKWKGQNLIDLDPYEVQNYVEFLKKKAKEDGKEITGQVAEFINRATHLLEQLGSPQEVPESIVDDLDKILGRK